MRDTKVKMCVWVDALTTKQMDNICGFDKPHRSRADFIRLAIEHELARHSEDDLTPVIVPEIPKEVELDKNGEPIGPWTDPEDLP